MKSYLRIILLAGLFAGPIGSIAQHTPPPGQTSFSAIEHWKQQAVWRNTDNAAGYFLDVPMHYSQLEAGTLFYGGAFKRPQQPRSGSRQNVHVEGNHFSNGFLFSGRFDYSRDVLHDVDFNATLGDPYRGMPYFIADLNPSKWVNQHYDMAFQITSRAFSRFRAGLDFDYRASGAMKQRDIRNENYLYRIALKPGLLYSIDGKNHIGTNFLFANLKEETRNSNNNVYVNQTFYRLLGLGHAIEGIGDGQDIQYDGSTVSGGLQYHRHGAWDIFLAGSYAVAAEDANVDFINPMAIGTALRKTLDAGLTLRNDRTALDHRIALKYRNTDTDGIEHVVQRQGSTAVPQWVTVAEIVRSNYANVHLAGDYRLTASRNGEIAWTASVGLVYDRLDDRYYMPVSLKNAENICYKTGLSYHFHLHGGLKSLLILGMDYLYSDNLSGGYRFGGAKRTPIAEEMETADMGYLTANYSEVTIPAVYSQKFSRDSKSQFYVKGVFHFIRPNQRGNDLRHYLGFGFGANL